MQTTQRALPGPLFCLFLCTPLRPLLAALVPEHFPAQCCTRALSSSPAQLGVFVRREGSDYVAVAVGAAASAAVLKDAVIAKLRLTVAPDHVRLLREARCRRHPPVPLDSSLPLARQRVVEGSRILAVVTAELPVSMLQLAAFSGALAPAPDAALDPALLAALSAPSTGPALRLSALNALLLAQRARSPQPPGSSASALPLFHTQAHAELLEALVEHAGVLAAGGFEGSNGTACRTLVGGARGTGKTAMLRAFAAVAPSAFPGLSALYLSCEGIEHSASPLHAAPLADWLRTAASAHSPSVRAHLHSQQQQRQHPSPLNLDAALAASGHRVLVLLDEVDGLYRLSAAYPAAVASVRSTLAHLGILGSSTTGLYGVLLCGSSASTYSLVSGDASSLGHKFPLAATGVPNLNSSKYVRILLRSAHCGASGEVAGMLAALAGGRDDAALAARLLPEARLLCFFVGTTPRAVVSAALARRIGSAAREGGAPSLTTLQLAAAIPPARLPAGPASLPGAAQLLLSVLMERLRIANEPLRTLVRCKDGTANPVELMGLHCRWEEYIVPLTWKEVQSVWVECAGALGLEHAARDPGVLRRLMDDIADAQVLHVRTSAASGLEEVWPATAAQVVAAGEVPRAWLEEAARRLRPVAALVSDAAAVARAAQAAGSVAAAAAAAAGVL